MELRCRKPAALSPSNSMIVPYVRRHLAVAPPPKIPAGWGVEEVPRRNGSHTDRYYYEPGTGKKFRSIREVDDYLNGGKSVYSCIRSSTRKSTYNNSEYRRRLLSAERRPKRSCKHRRMIVSGGKLIRVDDEVSQSHLAMVPYGKPAGTSPFILPDGWVVEEVPRRYNQCSPDKYYYEPGTGRKFRSLTTVERHLAELEENAPLLEENAPLSKTLEEIKENIPLSKVFKLESLTKNSKKKAPEEHTQASSFVGPPMEVKWVLASPQGDAWNPYISEELISDDVKNQWTNRFMLFMNQGNK